MANYRRKNLVLIISIFLLLIIFFLPLEVKINLDENIRLFEGQEHCFQLKFPLDLYVKADKAGILDLNGTPLTDSEFNRLKYHHDFALTGLSRGNVSLEFSLFRGLIPLRQLTVNVLPEMKLMAGGHSIGIKLHEEGVIVVGYYYLQDNERLFSPAEEGGLQIGDVLIFVNDNKLNDIDKAAEIIKKESQKGKLSFKVKRNGQLLTIVVNPYLCPDTGEYCIGSYIRDTAAGVGTLTFYDPEKKYYGALGHVITELDSNAKVQIDDGQIVRADIINIKKAQRGQPGEKAGIFREGRDIVGTIEKNTYFGIFGRLQNMKDCITPYPDPLPVALAFQVEKGPAEILTVIRGNKIESFAIEIEKTTNQNKPGDRGIIIRIVDEELLEAAGGIVQGMSGSPIIQNGKLVGAVTHVFINDPTRGYGIYAEWMIQETEIIPVS
jgi:stage IV sporulation protein B